MKLTRDEILNMPARRALDALIEHHVMKTPVPRNSDGHLSRSWVDGYGYENTFYSTDIAAAWEVCSFLRENHSINIYTTTDGGFGVQFNTLYGKPKVYRASAKTLPLAICRAALLAVTDTYR